MVASQKIVAVVSSRLPTTDMGSQFIKTVGDVTQWRVVRDESVLINSNEDRCMVASFIGL